MDWNMYNKELISFFFYSRPVRPHIGISIFFKEYKPCDVAKYIYSTTLLLSLILIR